MVLSFTRKCRRINSTTHEKYMRRRDEFCSFFPMVLNSEHQGWLVHCENWLHWWAMLAVWLLKSKNLEFFQWTKYEFGFSNQQTLSFFWWTKNEVWVNQKKLKVCWWEKPNSFEWTGKTQGFLMREAKLQPLQINEANSHSKLINQRCEWFKTIGKNRAKLIKP